MSVKIFTLILVGLLSSISYLNLSQTFAKISKTPEVAPLVLQIQISHPRNVDQTSLIFREETVDFVTNSFQISSQEKSPKFLLGHFQTTLNDDFKILQKQIVSIRNNLISKNEKKVADSKDKKSEPVQVVPHAPVIYIGGNGDPLTIREDDTHFESLRNILFKVRDQDWKCISCAKYEKKGTSIARTVEKENQKATSRTFSREALKCVSLDEDRIECIDPQFGIFEL